MSRISFGYRCDRADSRVRVVEIPWVLSRWSGERRVLDLGYAYATGYYLSAVTALGAR